MPSVTCKPIITQAGMILKFQLRDFTVTGKW
jgi:hypothetical protein